MQPKVKRRTDPGPYRTADTVHEKNGGLEHGDEFSRTLLRSAPYPILVTGLDTSVQYVNPAFERLTGFSSAELLGRKSPYPWWPPEKVREYTRANITGRKKELNKLERYYRKKNGELFWVVLHIAPVKYNGEIRYFIANWLDFTERKRAEEALQESEARFRMLSENSLSGIFILSRGRLSYANPALASMLGRSRQELTGCDPLSFIHPEDLHRVVRAMHRRLKGEYNHLSYAFRCLRKDGKTIWLEVLTTRFEFDGEPALLGTVLDVTEQRQAEQEAEQLRQIMAHVSRVNTLGELASSLAHELNQPLTAILTNAGTALRMIQNNRVNLEELKGILEDIAADDRQAGEIIRRMREPLRRGALKLELLDINQIIRDICRLVRNDAILAGVTLELSLSPSLPSVKGDRTQLQQVLLNLLVNALDAVKDPAARKRWVGVKSAAEQDGQVMVEVADCGPGIPETNRGHLFEPFYTTKPGGLGVGLSICKNIVESHGGRIREEDRPEGGARFIFTLPGEMDTHRLNLSGG